MYCRYLRHEFWQSAPVLHHISIIVQSSVGARVLELMCKQPLSSLSTLEFESEFFKASADAHLRTLALQMLAN